MLSRSHDRAAPALIEDEVEQAVAAVLAAEGWTVQVQRVHTHGIDIATRRGTERWVIEAKGIGTRPQMRVNFFLGAIGKLVQHMDAPDICYGLALPAHPQLARLVQRLPLWGRQHLGLHGFLVRRTVDGAGYEVGWNVPVPTGPSVLEVG